MRNIFIQYDGQRKDIKPAKTLPEMKKKIESTFPCLQRLQWELKYQDQDQDDIIIDQDQQYVDILNEQKGDLLLIALVVPVQNLHGDDDASHKQQEKNQQRQEDANQEIQQNEESQQQKQSEQEKQVSSSDNGDEQKQQDNSNNDVQERVGNPNNFRQLSASDKDDFSKVINKNRYQKEIDDEQMNQNKEGQKRFTQLQGNDASSLDQDAFDDPHKVIGIQQPDCSVISSIRCKEKQNGQQNEEKEGSEDSSDSEDDKDQIKIDQARQYKPQQQHFEQQKIKMNMVQSEEGEGSEDESDSEDDKQNEQGDENDDNNVYQQQCAMIKDGQQQQDKDLPGQQHSQRDENEDAELNRKKYVLTKKQANLHPDDQLDRQQSAYLEQRNESDVQQNVSEEKEMSESPQDHQSISYLVVGNDAPVKGEVGSLQIAMNMNQQQFRDKKKTSISEEQHLQLKRKIFDLQNELERTRQSHRVMQRNSGSYTQKCIFCQRDSIRLQWRYPMYQHILICDACHRKVQIKMKVRDQ